MKTTVKITILLIFGMITKGYSQISVNLSPTYNIIRQDYTVTGLGIEAGVRFRSSKIFRYGIDAGYNQGIVRTPQIVYSNIDSSLDTIYSGQHSYIPIQGVMELQSINNDFQVLAGIGLGIGFWNIKSIESSLLFSGHFGFSYKISQKINILTKAKLILGRIFVPMADGSSGFYSFNPSVGINYQFNNK